MREPTTQKPSARRSDSFAEARTGLFRATLLFGSIAAALALIVVPAIDHRARSVAAQAEGENVLDDTITGSISRPVPEANLPGSIPDRVIDEPCLIFPDGSQRGAC